MGYFNQQHQTSPPIRTEWEKNAHTHSQCWAICLQNMQGTTVLGTFGFHGWQPLKDTTWVRLQRIPGHWHSSVLPCHCIPLLVLSLSLSFLYLGVPSSPVTCFTICSCRWYHPEKSKSLVSPNPSWFSRFSLSQSSRENKWETGNHISKHRQVIAHTRNTFTFSIWFEVNAVYIGKPLPWHSSEQNCVCNSWLHLIESQTLPALLRIVHQVSNYSK